MVVKLRIFTHSLLGNQQIIAKIHEPLAQIGLFGVGHGPRSLDQSNRVQQVVEILGFDHAEICPRVVVVTPPNLSKTHVGVHLGLRVEEPRAYVESGAICIFLVSGKIPPEGQTGGVAEKAGQSAAIKPVALRIIKLRSWNAVPVFPNIRESIRGVGIWPKVRRGGVVIVLIVRGREFGFIDNGKRSVRKRLIGTRDQLSNQPVNVGVFPGFVEPFLLRQNRFVVSQKHIRSEPVQFAQNPQIHPRENILNPVNTGYPPIDNGPVVLQSPLTRIQTGHPTRLGNRIRPVYVHGRSPFVLLPRANRLGPFVPRTGNTQPP
eukprot:comp23907_c2_seq1/m.42106 comp23907_c2_seq1/g.42106  ORF comp23907_c2_seq1/g.42106 comp23907_c2_seq1/m.42106 type:complete len:319 (+) comp23907_c2_seq1:590-1546(+)